MKSNGFGEPVFGPRDHPDEIRDYLMDPPYRALIGNDERLNWSADIEDESARCAHAYEFDSEEALREWLGGLGDDVEIEVDDG